MEHNFWPITHVQGRNRCCFSLKCFLIIKIFALIWTGWWSHSRRVPWSRIIWRGQEHKTQTWYTLKSRWWKCSKCRSCTVSLRTKRVHLVQKDTCNGRYACSRYDRQDSLQNRHQIRLGPFVRALWRRRLRDQQQSWFYSDSLFLTNVQSAHQEAYCMCLKTMKQWSKWSLKEGVLQWDMFPGLTELHLTGCLVESTWTQKSKSST